MLNLGVEVCYSLENRANQVEVMPQVIISATELQLVA